MKPRSLGIGIARNPITVILLYAIRVVCLFVITHSLHVGHTKERIVDNSNTNTRPTALMVRIRRYGQQGIIRYQVPNGRGNRHEIPHHSTTHNICRLQREGSHLVSAVPATHLSSRPTRFLAYS